MKHIRGEYLVLSATFFAAIGWVSSKQVVELMPAAQFIGLRFLLAALILLPFCWSDIRKAGLRVLISTFGLGIILALHLLLWIYAVSISDNLGEGAFIMSLAMLFAPLLAWLLYQKAPTRSFWYALPLGITGMVLLSLSSSWQFSGSQFFFLFSAFLLSLHFNLNKNLTALLPTLSLVCIQLSAVGICALTISSFSDEPASQMTNIGWVWFVVATILATSLRYFLQTWGQSKMDTATASVLMIVEPIWTLIFSVFMFGESLPVSKVSGCVLIVIALMIYRLSERKTGKIGTTPLSLKIYK